MLIFNDIKINLGLLHNQLSQKTQCTILVKVTHYQNTRDCVKKKRGKQGSYGFNDVHLNIEQTTFLKWFTISNYFGNKNITGQQMLDIISTNNDIRDRVSKAMDKVVRNEIPESADDKMVLRFALQNIYNNNSVMDPLIHTICMLFKDNFEINNGNNINNRGSDRNPFAASVFNNQDIHVSILKYLNYTLLSKCARVSRDWTFRCYGFNSIHYAILGSNNPKKNIIRFKKCKLLKILNDLEYLINLKHYHKVLYLECDDSQLFTKHYFLELLKNNMNHLQYLCVEIAWLRIARDHKNWQSKWKQLSIASNITKLKMIIDEYPFSLSKKDTPCDIATYLTCFFSKFPKVSSLFVQGTPGWIPFVLTAIVKNNIFANNINEFVFEYEPPSFGEFFEHKEQTFHLPKSIDKLVIKANDNSVYENVVNLLILSNPTNYIKKSIIAKHIILQTNMELCDYADFIATLDNKICGDYIYDDDNNPYNLLEYLKLVSLIVESDNIFDLLKFLLQLEQTFGNKLENNVNFTIDVVCTYDCGITPLPDIRGLHSVCYLFSKLNINHTFNMVVQFDIEYKRDEYNLYHYLSSDYCEICESGYDTDDDNDDDDEMEVQEVSISAAYCEILKRLGFTKSYSNPNLKYYMSNEYNNVYILGNVLECKGYNLCLLGTSVEMLKNVQTELANKKGFLY